MLVVNYQNMFIRFPFFGTLCSLRFYTEVSRVGFAVDYY